MTLTQSVGSNDGDPEGGVLRFSMLQGPSHGTLSMATDGLFTYTPSAHYAGTDSFSYTASDGVLSDTATVTLTITPVNDAPVARADRYDTEQGRPVSGNVLLNDTDVEGTSLSAQLVRSVAQGTLSLSADGRFTYTPRAGFAGSDSFTYRASDGSATSAATTVTLMVANVNDAPVARADAFVLTEDARRTGNVLANDSDPDGDALVARLLAGPAHGSLTLAADGSFSYVPTPDYFGADSFEYEASDGRLSHLATVSLEIQAAADAPQARADKVLTQQGQSVSGQVLANDADADGGALQARLASGTLRGGEVALQPDGQFTYTPAPGFVGQDQFSYRAVDASGLASAAALVTVQVDAPAHVAVYRFVNLDGGAYFYTASEAEKAEVLARYPSFRYEGPVFFADDPVQAQADSVAVYRFANLQTGGYFYTASEAEKDLVLAGYPHMRFEDAAFMLPASGEDLLPVYRFANVETGGYLFTQDPAEREAARQLPFMREENGGDPAFLAPARAGDLSRLQSTAQGPVLHQVAFDQPGEAPAPLQVGGGAAGTWHRIGDLAPAGRTDTLVFEVMADGQYLVSLGLLTQPVQWSVRSLSDGEVLAPVQAAPAAVPDAQVLDLQAGLHAVELSLSGAASAGTGYDLMFGIMG